MKNLQTRKPRANSFKTAGFTLTELLVVMAIISVLAALLLPAVSLVKNNVKKATCSNNLRQMGIAMFLHLEDNESTFPDGRRDYPWPNSAPVWYEAISNYTVDYPIWNWWTLKPLPKIFDCPSGNKSTWNNLMSVTAYPWPYTGDYAANRTLGQPEDKQQGQPDLTKFLRFKHPAEMPFVQDTIFQNNWKSWIFGLNHNDPTGNNFSNRHMGGGNILWLDGRATWFEFYAYRKYTYSFNGNPGSFVNGTW